VEEFDSIVSALSDYLDTHSASFRPTRATLAVASAVTDDHIQFTNSPWSFSAAALKESLGFEALNIINDFAAVALAIPELQQGELEAVNGEHEIIPSGTYVALGPGTGLGVAGLKRTDTHTTVLETEGGHISFAPRNEDEMRLFKFLKKEFPRVSYERLLCGTGLHNLYRAHCNHLKRPAMLMTPSDVTQAARQHDPAARAAVDDFCSILGAFAGDAALMYGAWSGVYLSGGLLPHVMNDHGKVLFCEAFEDKGRFSGLLRKTPVWLIKRDDVGTFGAACAAPP
jgi:glucokinase